MAKPSYGVIVGRFQVNALHDGHTALFDAVFARHNRVIVFIGVNPAGLSKNHPLDYTCREVMIRSAYPPDKFPGLTIQPLQDCRTDDEWSAALDSKIDEVVKYGDVTLYGGRDSFVPHYTGRFKPVEITLPPKIAAIKGTDIREKYSDTIIASPEFRAGMIYANAQKWPEILPCVDIAILSYDYQEVLLGRRKTEKQWRFCGGHVERKHGSDNTYEKAAREEAIEEAGSDLIDLTYIGSAIVDDWRVAGAPDKMVTTAFFAGRVSNMGARAGDDINEVKWFKIADLKPVNFVSEHVTLFSALINYLRNKGVFHYAETVQAASVAQD